MRNSIDLAKRYFLSEPLYIAANLIAIFKSLILLCIFENDRLKKLRYSGIGFLDGVSSKFDRQSIYPD